MLGCQVGGYIKPCAPVTGGVAQLLVGDANDFDWTTGTPTPPATDAVGYDTVGLHTGAVAASGALLYEITSLSETLGVDITQANADGSSSSYEYVISARLAQLSQTLTNFNMKLDAAAVCCQLVFVWRMNDGKIFVIGEKWVDDVSIIPFKIRNDGSKFSTGKKFSDFNGEDLSLKGNYTRPPFEYIGSGVDAWADLEALM